MTDSVRLLRTALTGALLCVCLSVTASALGGVGTVTGDCLRLREQANTDCAILTTVAKGTDVTVLDNQPDGWYKVDWNGTVGYMSADYLSVTLQAQTGTLDTDGSTLNLRAGPGTDFDALVFIPADAVLTITGIENGWYKTSYNGMTGFVSSDYVILSESADMPAETPVESPAEVQSPAEETSETLYAYLNTDGANLYLRAGPGTDYDRLASVPSTAVLTVTGIEGNWIKTTYLGVEGYVCGDYIQLTNDAPSFEQINSDLASQVIAYAKQFLGLPYVYGASGPTSFDCSGFTSYVYEHFGYSLNRSAAGQYSNGTPIDESQLQPGDLLVWRAYGSSKTATHVGIYIGGNQYIHASSTGACIKINDMDYGSSSRYLVGIRRILA